MEAFENGADVTPHFLFPNSYFLFPLANVAVGHCMPSAKRSMKANAFPSTKQREGERESSPLF